jgi:hypothetical protein
MMAEITLQVPNEQIPRVVNALCQIGGYSGDPDDQPARRAFAKRVLADHLRRMVLRVEASRIRIDAMAAGEPLEVE